MHADLTCCKQPHNAAGEGPCTEAANNSSLQARRGDSVQQQAPNHDLCNISIPKWGFGEGFHMPANTSKPKQSKKQPYRACCKLQHFWHGKA